MQTPQFFAQSFEFYRAGLRTMTEAAQASLEGAERLQRQQLELLRGAVEDGARSARELAEAKSFDEMLSLQTRYGRAQFDRTIDFWARVWRSVGENQMPTREAIRDVTSQGRHERKTA
jgi:hypothetical protein